MWAAIRESADVVAQPYEIIVVNDASTDATAEVARRNHARVVDVNHRQIAATRNSGARVSNGECLFFVDADTTIDSGPAEGSTVPSADANFTYSSSPAGVATWSRMPFAPMPVKR